jgi:hypothetical protein
MNTKRLIVYLPLKQIYDRNARAVITQNAESAMLSCIFCILLSDVPAATPNFHPRAGRWPAKALDLK